MMNLRRAFNAKMLHKMIRYLRTGGSYDNNNEWVEGTMTTSTFFGVITAGNKFSQFDEGIARRAEEGGERFSDYRTLYVSDRWPVFNTNDKLKFKDTYYSILQKSDEEIFGFQSYIIEKPKNWSPT